MARTVFCKHYRGLYDGLKSRDVCEAGVNFKEQFGEKPQAKSLPCYEPSRGRNGLDPLPCPKCEYPTAEEIAADERETEERFERMGKIRAAIVASVGGPWKRGMMGVSGSVVCPCCGGLVHFSRAGVNGHIHAKCSTEGCASWME